MPFVPSLAGRKVLGFSYCIRRVFRGDTMRRREFITLVGGVALPKMILVPSAHAEGASKRPLVVWFAAYLLIGVGSRRRSAR